MKNVAVILCLFSLGIAACKSETDVLPQGGVWSAGCAQLSPDTAGYRLSGLCCAYVLFPNKLTSTDGVFTVKGSYHSFTGGGFSNELVDIHIQKTANGALILSYTLPNTTAPTVFQLTPGPATAFCYCGCD